MWQPPIRIYRAGRQTVNSKDYSNTTLKAPSPKRVLIKHTLKGEGSLYLGQRRYIVPEKHIFIIDRPGPHSYCFEGSTDQPWQFEYLSILLPLEDDSLPKDFMQQPVLDLTKQFETRKNITKLIDYYFNEKNDPVQISAMAYQLLLQIIKTKLTPKAFSDKVNKLKEEIDQNFTTDFSTNSLTKKLGRTAETLIRNFKKQVGLTPYQYLLEKRINKAKHLLEEGELELKQISRECGFSTTNYFIRLFKKTTGYTPAIYRKQIDLQIL